MKETFDEFWVRLQKDLDKPKWLFSKSVEDEDIEDAEFEIIEPKQLPESNQSK